MFQKTLSVWLFFSLFAMAFAQNTSSIEGFVLSATTHAPIEGASIKGNGLFAVSSASGRFVLKNVKNNYCVVTISSLGFDTKTVHLKKYSEADDIKIFLDEKATALTEITLTGKSNERKAQELPIISESISNEYLESNRENSLMQTLEKIPGISTINIGSGQSKPVIRGLGFNRVMVVQNGIKHEAQQWGNDHSLEIDQYNVNAINIIKGPASLMYGSDAIAGVVDILPSKTPGKNSFKGEVNLLGESNNDLLGVSTGMQARKSKWFYKTRLTYRDYGDYKVPTDRINYENYIFELHDNNLRNTSGREASASFNVGYTTKNITSETAFSNVNSKNGFFANAHGLEVRNSSIDYDSSSRDIDLPFHETNHFKITNNTKIKLNGHTLLVDLGFQNNNRSENSEPVPHGYMPKPDNSKERIFVKNTYSLNIKDEFKPNQYQHLVTGITIEHQHNNIGGWGFLIPNYKRFTVGGFGYLQWEMNPNLHLLTGARYDFGIVKTEAYFDWFRSTVNNADGTTSQVYLQRALNKTLDFRSFSGSVGLSYIQDKTNYKINIGKSFRMPLANELASDGVNYHMYRFERGNLNLKPESSYQIDAEINHNANAFSINVSPFINYFSNYIYLNPTPNYYESLQIYEYTQAEVFRFGGEFKTSTTFFERLNLQATVQYVYSRQTSGAKKGFALPFSPPLSGMFSASYRFNDILFLDHPEFMADFKVAARQNEIVPPEEQTSGYQVLNLSLLTNAHVFNRNNTIIVRLKVNNVFNTKYFNHTSFYRLIDVPEAGRNISVSLTIPF